MLIMETNLYSEKSYEICKQVVGEMCEGWYESYAFIVFLKNVIAITMKFK
jgi:hypothetical protein